MEKQKDTEKGDSQRIQTEMLNAIKDDARKTAVYGFQHAPNGLYQKKNYTSYFLGIDKKFSNEFLNFRTSVKNAIKKVNIENIGVFDLKEYSEYFADILQANEKFFQKGKPGQGSRK